MGLRAPWMTAARLWAALTLVLGALAAIAPAHAQDKPLNGLGARGTPVGTDIIPILPSGGTTLQAAKLSDVVNLALTSVKAAQFAGGAKGDGATDDTAAIQAAINSGLAIYFPPGTYVVSAPLLVESYANNGQVLRGSGSWGFPGTYNSTLPNAGAAVIRPTSALSGHSVFVIDGTPISGGGYQLSWVQGFGIENLVIDMANMSDVSTSAAINQIQAWDAHYTGVRVVNDGSNKRGWLFTAGAFTTTLLNDQASVLDFEGASFGYGVTTITVINCDCGRVVSNYANSLKFIGGAFQKSDGSTRFYLRNGADYEIRTDVEGNGVYLDVNANVTFLRSQAELQGFTGTYMTGTVGNNSTLWDDQTSYQTYPTNFTSGYLQLNNAGTGANSDRSTFLSGSAAHDEYLYLGRAAGESVFGVVGVANDFTPGTVAGDTVIGSNNPTENTYIMAAGVKAALATSTGFNTYGTGTLAEAVVNVSGSVNTVAEQVKPATNGQEFTLSNAANSNFFICSSSATIASSNCGIGNGATLTGYSDNYSNLTIDLNAATGSAHFTGPVDGSGFIGTTSASSLGTTTVTSLTTTVTTFSSLPASPVIGMRGFISDDSAACTFLTAASGGGSTKCPVVYNGAAWVAG